MTFVKICGLKDPAAVAVALDAGADAVGFVMLVPASPRNVDRDGLFAASRPVARMKAPRAKLVIVTADATQRQLDDIVCEIEPDVIQLHGRETPNDVRRLRADMNLDDGGPAGQEIWKAISVGSADDLKRAVEYDGADRLVLDAKPPKGAGRTGGFGAPFDWSILADWTAPKPWILSGGLAPETVAEAIRVTGATAVDVSSGVESAPGVKDPARIAAFVAAAKATRPAGAAA